MTLQVTQQGRSWGNELKFGDSIAKFVGKKDFLQTPRYPGRQEWHYEARKREKQGDGISYLARMQEGRFSCELARGGARSGGRCAFGGGGEEELSVRFARWVDVVGFGGFALCLAGCARAWESFTGRTVNKGSGGFQTSPCSIRNRT